MTGNPKIAFVIHSLEQGGAERVVSTLANSFSEKYPVTIICLVRTKVFYPLDARIKLRSCKDSTPSSNPLVAIRNNIKTIRLVTRILKEEEINVVIGFTTSANVISILSAKLAGTSAIISERNNAKINPPNLLWRSLRNITYRFSDYLVVQTLGNKEFYRRIIKEDKIEVIQNPMSGSIASRDPHKKGKHMPLEIITVARLNPNKAHHIILLALSQLQEFDWTYTIIGDGCTKQELIAMSKSLGIEGRVHFTGMVKNVGDFYNKADIFVFTSRSEGFPNALMEAYYMGIPCISTDCDYGPSDIITNGLDGFLIPVDDEKELRAKLEVLMTDPNLRKKFAENALATSSRFNIQDITSQWNDIICASLAIN